MLPHYNPTKCSQRLQLVTHDRTAASNKKQTKEPALRKKQS
jgi:hypothetical protein